jgi:hypothetical protein
MKTLKAWVVLMLVFVAGFAGGVAVTRGVVRHVVHNAINDPDFMRHVIERRMTAKLRLDQDQRAKVDEILLHTQGELKDLREDFRPRFLALLSQTKSEIEEILTPEQKERFEKLRAENQHWWQGR